MTARAPLTALHVACGAGGISLGFESAGISTALAFDIDQTATETHLRNMPQARTEVLDLAMTHAEDLPHADVFACGIPCEMYSTAGYQRGLLDDRDLTPDVARILEELIAAGRGPRYVFLENVPPFLRSAGAAMIRQALTGYSITEAIFRHADYGICQARKRWHLLAAREGPAPIPVPTHSEEPGFTTDRWIRFGEIRERDPRDPHYVSALAWRGIIRRQTANEIKAIERTSTTNTSFAKVYIVDDDSLMSTVLASWFKGHSRNQATVVFDDYRFRSPTVLEVKRSQGFPDDFEFCGNVRQTYEQIARAVAPPFAAAVARAFIEHSR